MSEMLSSFHGSTSNTGDNPKLVRNRQTGNNPSTTVTSNDTSKSTEFSNTSVESLVSINKFDIRNSLPYFHVCIGRIKCPQPLMILND